MSKRLAFAVLVFYLSLGLIAVAEEAEKPVNGLIVDGLIVSASENDGLVELKKLLEPMSSVSADFRQQLYSADEYQIQDNQGHMQVSAPGKIRWIVDSPMEQWLISDGETLWLYDPDLEQVIIKAFDQRVSAAPALLLTGSVSELSELFQVSEVDVDDEESSSANRSDTRRFQLKPNDEQALYEYLVFDFDGPRPIAMIIFDSLGQRTQITFSNVVLNKEVDPSLYAFEPPPGIDIIHDK